MKKYIFFVYLFFFGNSSFSQDFNSLVTQTADTLAKKIFATGKKKIGVTDFVGIDQSISQLGVFIGEEISSELANLTENQTKFRVLERANLNQIFKEKNLINLTEPSALAKELGKIDAADALAFATITDFDGYYRVVIKLLDTKNGDALCSYKVNFVKTPSLETLHKQIVKRGQTSVAQIQSSSQPSDNIIIEQPKDVGDVCFTAKTFYEYNLALTIFKVKSDDVEKTINVSKNETTCAYELTAGVHKVELKWLFAGGGGNEVHKTEYKEIRVLKGKSVTIEYNKGY